MPARLTVAILLLLVPAAALAQDGESIRDTLEAAATPVDAELRSMRAMSLAGAFVGGGSGSGALFHNPAGILTAAVYEATAGYQRNFGSDSNAIGASVADAKTNPSLAAAFSYSFGFGRNDALRDAFEAVDDNVSRTEDRFRNHDIRAGLAFPIVPQRFALGAGIHYVNHHRGSWREQTEREVIIDIVDAEGNPTGETTTRVEVTTVDREISSRGLSLDAGALAKVSDQISIGFAARNLLEVDGYPHGRRLEAGLGGFFDALHVEAAWFTEQRADDTWAHGVAVGFEYVVESAPLRLGYRYDGVVDANFVTSGVGFRSERVGGDVAFEQNVNHTAERRIGANVSLYF